MQCFHRFLCDRRLQRNSYYIKNLPILQAYAYRDGEEVNPWYHSISCSFATCTHYSITGIPALNYYQFSSKELQGEFRIFRLLSSSKRQLSENVKILTSPFHNFFFIFCSTFYYRLRTLSRDSTNFTTLLYQSQGL